MTNGRRKSLATPPAITRRDFVNSMLIGTGAALCTRPAPLFGTARGASPKLLAAPDLGLDWYGYGGVGEYADSHGNTPEAVFRAHSVRDGLDAGMPAMDTKEIYDLVIVGGGMAGLGAALRFQERKRRGERALLFDNHPVFGGESKRNEFLVDGYRLIAPQGANGFSVPPEKEPGFASGDARYFGELDIPRRYSYPDWPADLKQLHFGQDDYGFLYWLEETVSIGYFVDEQSHGVEARWLKNPWEERLHGLPVSEEVRRDLLRWRYWDQRPSAAEDFKRWLDSMTYRDFVVNELKLRPEVAAYADPILASAAGACSDVLSAYAAYAIGMPGVRAFSAGSGPTERHSFPGGNDGFARLFVKAVAPDAIEGGASFEEIINGRIRFDLLDAPGNETRMRLGATVVGVEHEGAAESSDSVIVTYVKDRRLYRLRARRVVMATGGWISKYVVRDIPAGHKAAYETFVHTAVLVANVALTNWRFLYDLGITGFRWWEDLGFAACLKRPMHVGRYQPPFHPDKPVVLSFYIPLYYPGRSSTEQGIRGRTEILSTSFAEYESKLRKLMTRLFAKYGFDHEKDIAGIILNRWGHAYLAPTPGFYHGRNGEPPPSDIIRRRHGRIAFGHSELRGNQHWGPAAAEGSRAVDQLIDAV